MGKCKNCKHWQPKVLEYYENLTDFNVHSHGKCNDAIYWYDDEVSMNEMFDFRSLVYADSEGYRAEVYTGKEFGCINFEKK